MKKEPFVTKAQLDEIIKDISDTISSYMMKKECVRI